MIYYSIVVATERFKLSIVIFGLMNYYAELGLHAISEYRGDKGKINDALAWEDLELIGKIVFLGRDYRVQEVTFRGIGSFEAALRKEIGIAGIVNMLKEHSLPEPTEAILHLPVKIFGFKTAEREY